MLRGATKPICILSSLVRFSQGLPVSQNFSSEENLKFTLAEEMDKEGKSINLAQGI